jgi:hypothetical protein
MSFLISKKAMSEYKNKKFCYLHFNYLQFTDHII